jgi:hypothetical protein
MNSGYTNGRYHAVCRDCEAEKLFRREVQADRWCSYHRSATGHTTEFADLGSGDSTTVDFTRLNDK